MTPTARMACEECWFWRAYEGSETGTCQSVVLNDYAGAYLAAPEGTDERFVALVTNAGHFCADFQTKDGAR